MNIKSHPFTIRPTQLWHTAVCLIIAAVIAPTGVFAENLDSILHVLDTCVIHKAQYEARYAARMDSMRREMRHTPDMRQKMRCLTEIGIKEYHHNGDAALQAFNQALIIARQLNDSRSEWIIMKWKALTYGRLGFPWEGERILDSLCLCQRMTPEQLGTLYTAYYDLYDFYGAWALPGEVADRQYQFLQHIEDSVRRHLTTPGRQAMTIHYATHDERQMIRNLKTYLLTVPDEIKGIVATVISNKYFMIRDVYRRDYYWALASVYNLKNACHENEALTRLSIRLFEKGDSTRAARYALAAYDDARIYNTRIRKAEVAMPLAWGLSAVSRHNTTLLKKQTMLLATLAGLLLAVGIAVVITVRRITRLNRQLRAVSAARGNEQQQLDRLKAEVATKNEYITRFLELSLDALFQIEQSRHAMLVKLKNGDTDRLEKMLKASNRSGTFQEQCLKRFDIAFLRLHPDFLQRVNSLFLSDDKIILPDEEIMNNELRILAFMQLGITDSARVACILGVSINTIYFYRNRLRKRAVNRDKLEQDVLRLYEGQHDNAQGADSE